MVKKSYVDPTRSPSESSTISPENPRKSALEFSAECPDFRPNILEFQQKILDFQGEVPDCRPNILDFQPKIEGILWKFGRQSRILIRDSRHFCTKTKIFGGTSCIVRGKSWIVGRYPGLFAENLRFLQNLGFSLEILEFG